MDSNITNVREMICRGEKTLRAILGDELYTAIEPSSQLKILFSMLDDKPVSSDVVKEGRVKVAVAEGNKLVRYITKNIRDGSAICANGLSMRDMLYPFSVEYQEFLYKGALAIFVRAATSNQEAFSKLAKINEEWRSFYVNSSIETVKKELWVAHRGEVKDLRQKYNNLYLRNTKSKYKLTTLADMYEGLSTMQLVDVIYRMGSLNSRVNEAMKKCYITDKDKFAERRATVQQQMKATICEEINKEYGIVVDYDVVDRMLNATAKSAFEKYLVSSGALTESEFKEYTSFAENKREIRTRVRRLIDVEASKLLELEELSLNEERRKFVEARRNEDNISLINAAVKISNKEKTNEFSELHNISAIERKINYLRSRTTAKTDSIRRKHTNRLNTYIEDIKSEIVRKLDALEAAVKSEKLKEYDRNTPRDIDYRVDDKTLRVRNSVSICEAYAKFKVETEKLLRYYMPTLFEAGQDYIDLCGRYYSYLLIRQAEARAKWGQLPARKQNELSRKLSDLESEYSLLIEEEAKVATTADFNDVMRKVIKAVGDREMTGLESIVVCPIGIMIVENGRFDVLGFSPVDTRIREALTETQWEHWQEAWKSFYTNGINVFDASIRELVMETVETAMSKISELSDYEQRLAELSEEYAIELPKVLFKDTGYLATSATAGDVEILDDVLPVFGKYFRALVTGNNSFSAEVFKDGLNDFFLNGKDFSGFIVKGKAPELSLTITALNAIAQSTGYKTQEVRTILAASIAAKVYLTLPGDHIVNFAKLREDKLNVSKLDLYRLSGAKVDSVIERRAYVTRALFVKEFTSYLTGDCESDVSALFGSIDRVFEQSRDRR